MSAPDENWGGDDIPISGPSQAAEAAVIGEEGAIIVGSEQQKQARAEAKTTTVGTPSGEASTVELKQQRGASKPLSRGNAFTVNLHSNVNPSFNNQNSYGGEKNKPKAESNDPPRFELFLLGDGEKKVTETPDTRKSSTSYPVIHHY